MVLLGAVVELCGMTNHDQEFPAGINLIDRRLVGTILTIDVSVKHDNRWASRALYVQ